MAAGAPGIRKGRGARKRDKVIQTPDDPGEERGILAKGQKTTSDRGTQFRYELFCQEYIADLNMNATQAAINAGYSPKTARTVGWRLLSQPYIQNRIQKMMDDRLARTQITADRALTEAAKVAFSDVRKLFREDGELKDIHEIDDDTAAAVSSIQITIKEQFDKDGNPTPLITKKIKLWDKNPALTNIMKNMKLLVDRVENVYPEKVHFIIER